MDILLLTSSCVRFAFCFNFQFIKTKTYFWWICLKNVCFQWIEDSGFIKYKNSARICSKNFILGYINYKKLAISIFYIGETITFSYIEYIFEYMVQINVIVSDIWSSFFTEVWSYIILTSSSCDEHFAICFWTNYKYTCKLK